MSKIVIADPLDAATGRGKPEKLTAVNSRKSNSSGNP
jgi:hypothetical protein